MVFSCGYPSEDAGLDASFTDLLAAAAADDVGTSFFGVLLGYDPNLGTQLGDAHGGAYYYLQDLNAVAQVFDEDFDVMVTPLAYDLNVAVEVSAGYQLDRVYGVPGDAQGAPKSTLTVATAFLSHRHGALVARLSRDPAAIDAVAGAPVATVRLSYTAAPALGFADGSESAVVATDATASSADPTYYGGPGVRKAVALVNEAESMSAACAAFASGDHDHARALLLTLADYLRAEAVALATTDLDGEVALVEKLLANMGD